ncbi:MAG: PEGA domain-containing protein [Acidobacteriota bacterium]
MKLFRNALILSVMTFLLCACTPVQREGTAGSRGANANQPAANSNASQSKPANDSAAGTGSIEVASAPPGARVLLIPVDEGGASEPQMRGVTPTTITGLSPGKYAVDLEKPGYKPYQKEVVVNADSTAKVKAKLRR